LAEAKTVAKGAVRREPDPTMCVRCGADHGETRLEPVAGAPMCPSCVNHLRNFPFPLWLKLAAVGLVALVAFSLTWNSRFILAYVEIRRLNAAMSEGDFDGAAALITAAADHVPEDRSLRMHANFLQGIALLQQDKCDEALTHFKQCQQLPPDTGIRSLTAQAEIGAAFNSKDYDRFLDKAQASLQETPQDRSAVAMVASAYACKYAVTGDQQFRDKALEMLKKAG
jgi:tetratricopeptide (TPR) repeat protein